MREILDQKSEKIAWLVFAMKGIDARHAGSVQRPPRKPLALPLRGSVADMDEAISLVYGASRSWPPGLGGAWSVSIRPSVSFRGVGSEVGRRTEGWERSVLDETWC